jgi:hypothetical protein
MARGEAAASGGGARERIGDNIGGPGRVAVIGGEIRPVRHLPLLAARPGRRNATYGGDKRFVVCQEPEFSTFQEEAEMADRAERCQQLPVKCGIFGFRRRQFV